MTRLGILLVLTVLMAGCLEVETEYELITDGNASDIKNFAGTYYEKNGDGFIRIDITKLPGKGHYKVTRQTGDPEDESSVNSVRTHRIDDEFFLAQLEERDEDGPEFATYPCKVENGALFYLDLPDDDLSDQYQAEIEAAVPKKREGLDRYNPFFVNARLSAFKEIVLKYLAHTSEEKIYYAPHEVKALKDQPGVQELADRLVFHLGRGLSPFRAGQPVSSAIYDLSKGPGRCTVIIRYDNQETVWFDANEIKGVRIGSREGRATVILDASITWSRGQSSKSYAALEVVAYKDFAAAKEVKDLLLAMAAKPGD